MELQLEHASSSDCCSAGIFTYHKDRQNIHFKRTEIIFIFRKTVIDFHQNVVWWNKCDMFSAFIKYRRSVSSRVQQKKSKGGVDTSCRRWVRMKQVSEVRWKVSLAKWCRTRREYQMANWQSVLLCQNECVSRRRKVELDERKEIRSDLIWNH